MPMMMVSFSGGSLHPRTSDDLFAFSKMGYCRHIGFLLLLIGTSILLDCFIMPVREPFFACRSVRLFRH